MGASPGWYEDPAERGWLRWWDGAAWTDHRHLSAQPQVESPWGSSSMPSAEPGPVTPRRARGVHPAIGAAALVAGLIAALSLAAVVQRGADDLLDELVGDHDDEVVAESRDEDPNRDPSGDRAADGSGAGDAHREDVGTALDVEQELPPGIVATELLALPDSYTENPWAPLYGDSPTLSLSTADRWLRSRFWDEVAASAADDLDALGFTDATAHTWVLSGPATSASVTAEVARFDGSLEMAAWRAGTAICGSLPAWQGPEEELAPFAGTPAMCAYNFTSADEVDDEAAPEGIGVLIPHGPYLLHVQAMHGNFDTALERAAELAVLAQERLGEVADAPGRTIVMADEPAEPDDVVLHDSPEGLGEPLHTPPAEGARRPSERLPRTVVSSAEEWASAHLGDWEGAADAADALAELGFRYETTDEWGAPSANTGAEQVRVIRVLAFDDGEDAPDARKAARYVCDLFPTHMPTPHDVWFAPDDDDVPSSEALSALDDLPVVCFEFDESPVGRGFEQAKVTLVHGPYVIRAWGVATSRAEALDVLNDVAVDAYDRVGELTLP